MTEEIVTDRSSHELPFGRIVTFKNVTHDSGLRMMRMTIREGRRFTIVDLDENVAKAIGADMTDWAESDPNL